ncbi:MAG: hypothetical protein IJG34_11290 [Synergistaceae bacterium]|nr:hypothetical protein [Synergistaceae bacterium]MBQ3450465.1 hypothetical protein [Synergistaceae bacterium]MBQ3693772.1 hypothetical protein [Synergistaceae bacterium]MBQ6111196.1 hypothetical protein [Synergistaceae bacterium]MBQ9628362.1 hypothetical protein [Synergistaceae bacterium]
MYQVKNEAGKVELLLYDEIGRDGVTARGMLTQLKDMDVKEITLRISSYGGEINEAFGIYHYVNSLAVNKRYILTVYVLRPQVS